MNRWPPSVGSAGELSSVRWGAGIEVGLNLALVGAGVLQYPPLLAQPGALVYVGEPVALLLVYAGLLHAVTTRPSERRRDAVRLGTAVGLLTGALWIVNHALEVFTDLAGRVGLLATAPFLLGGFLLWGVAAGRAGWRTGSVRLGVLAAVWSAMLCVLIVSTFGLLVTYTATARVVQQLVADPDFLRSGWADLHAFAIANTFDAAFLHLLEAPIIATMVGGLGAFLGATLGRHRGPTAVFASWEG